MLGVVIGGRASHHERLARTVSRLLGVPAGHLCEGPAVVGPTGIRWPSPGRIGVPRASLWTGFDLPETAR